jgi:hypothetical protein
MLVTQHSVPWGLCEQSPGSINDGKFLDFMNDYCSLSRRTLFNGVSLYLLLICLGSRRGSTWPRGYTPC